MHVYKVNKSDMRLQVKAGQQELAQEQLKQVIQRQEIVNLTGPFTEQVSSAPNTQVSLDSSLNPNNECNTDTHMYTYSMIK